MNLALTARGWHEKKLNPLVPRDGSCCSYGTSSSSFSQGGEIKPVSCEEFEECLRRCGITPEKTEQLAVAVSGGPDSMALCLLAQRWAQRKREQGFRGTRVLALTVDHKLREESTREAAMVKLWLVEKLGITHRILTCEWQNKPRQGKRQQLARHQRYSLLCNTCQTEKVEYLLTAHHKQDQLETFLLRFAQLSNFEGLSGIQPRHRLTSDVTAVRPLLGFSKERLRRTCELAGLPYVEDPTNKDPSSCRRNHLRQQCLPRLLEVVEEDALLATIRHCQQMRNDVAQRVTSFIQDTVILEPRLGYCLIEASALLALEESLARRVLNRVLHSVSGKNRPIRTAQLTALRDQLARLFSSTSTTPIGNNSHGTVLCGCRLHYLPSSKQFLVCQELSQLELSSRIRLLPYSPLLWQQLFRLELRLPASSAASLPNLPSIYVRGLQAKDWKDTSLEKLIRRVVPSCARSAIPAIVDEQDRLLCVPSLLCFQQQEKDRVVGAIGPSAKAAPLSVTAIPITAAHRAYLYFSVDPYLSLMEEVPIGF
ncbi:tRNA(Ile)-lysidine synthetase [Balamuthia mandrillaris]